MNSVEEPAAWGKEFFLAGCRRHAHRSPKRTPSGVTALARRVVLAIVGLLGTGLAGAVTTVQTVVNSDHQACGKLLAMVKAAGVRTMTDAQLCDFRFARLPPSMLQGFTFPHWEAMSVADPTGMYFRLRTANVAPRSMAATNTSPWPSLMKSAHQAAADNNLAFYKAELQLEGKGAPLTFVLMDDVKNCSKLPSYLENMGVPYYAIFDRPDLQHSEPVFPSSESVQIALWKGNIPIQLSIWPYWVSVSDDDLKSMIQVTMEGLARSSIDGPFNGAIHAYSVCAFNIIKTKPVSRTTTP